MILSLYPNASPEWAAQIEAAMPAFDIVGVQRVSAYLGTLAVESAGFTRFEENLYYTSVSRLRAVMPRGFPTDESAAPYLRNPEALANFAYGGRYGNTRPGDGWLYRGRCPIQLTFADNYRIEGDALGIPLLQKPELAAQPEIGSRIAAHWYVARGCNQLADDGVLISIRRRVNGAETDLDKFLAAAKRFSEAL